MKKQQKKLKDFIDTPENVEKVKKRRIKKKMEDAEGVKEPEVGSYEGAFSKPEGEPDVAGSAFDAAQMLKKRKNRKKRK